MKPKKILFLITIFLSSIMFLYPKPALPYPADVKDIHGKDYFSATHEALQKAAESIVVVMYFVNFDPSKSDKVSTLLNDLVEAHKKGVKITVVLDRNIQFGEQRSGGDDFYVEEKNREAFDFLKNNGIDAFYDNKNVITHAKGVVIDGKTVIMGSTNWSKSSLDQNNELAVIIDSKELADKTLNYIKTIAIDNETSSIKPVSYKKLSKEVLTNPLSQLITSNNKSCWDMFLWLLGKYPAGTAIDFDYDIAAQELGIKEANERYREAINESLKVLQERYNLISLRTERGKNAEVVLTLSIKPGEAYFEIPETFWTYGWQKRLSMEAQFCLLVNLLKSGKEHKEWFASKTMLEDEFHIGHFLISKGMIELKRWNLIDIQWNETEDGYDKRLANSYRLNNIYSMEDFNAELEKLKSKYGTDNIGKSLKFANIVLDEYNLEHIEDIAIMINESGLEKVQYAFDKIAKYKLDNQRRTLRYVAGIVRTEERK